MACQRVGQSRRNKLLVAIATVLLCFLHLPINGSQTLAVPGSGTEAGRARLEKLKMKELKTKLREKGLKVSGRKADLVERLVKHMTMEIKRVRSGKREIPEALTLADPATDVFIPLDATVQKLESLLQKKRVVFIRAGVASGKSTLAQYLCMEQPSKYLQVFAPAFEKLTSFQNWQEKLRATLRGKNQDVEGDLQDAIKHVYDNDQVLVFDECHLLFSCPDFLSMFLKPRGLSKPPMMLLLSAASEAVDMRGRLSQTPAEITGKYMWTPPIPHPNALVDQLAEADVYLSEDAIEFFMSFCGGHRGIFMRAMEWVQMKQSKNSTQWDLKRALGEASQAWDTESWNEAADDSLMWKLQTVRAIRANGYLSALENIPQEFVDILCEGPTDGLDLNLRRELTINGLVLPLLKDSEFTLLDWGNAGTKYGVANCLMASYYRQTLSKMRKLTVDVDRNPVSCTDLLLRALPYLFFADVVAITGKEQAHFFSDVSQEELPFEVHYTAAVIQVLNRLGLRANSLESPTWGKVDIYCTMQDGSTFAIEAVMAARRPPDIEEHRNRFDRVTNYADAKHKCLLIIGRQDSNLRKIVQDTRGGIEIVGFAANAAHTGYHVYVKQQEQQGKEVLDFYIPCDGVARSCSFKEEKPFFEISSAQKLKSIQPGPDPGTQTKAVWVRHLQKDGKGGFEFVGNAFKITGAVGDVDDLKKAIETAEKLSIAPSKIEIYSQEDGKWSKEGKMSASLRDNDEDTPYGYIVP